MEIYRSRGFTLRLKIALSLFGWLRQQSRRLFCQTGALLFVFICVTQPARAETILVMGDSLSAAYGIPVEKGWVQLLRDRLGDQHSVINASISGETTSGGHSRFTALIDRHQPDIVILELGANDGLRGQPVATVRANLESMITQSEEIGAAVLLLGMKVPPNYGGRYAKMFEASFRDLADLYQLAWHPFFLDGVAGNPALIQADKLHPTAEAQPIMLDNIWPVLRPLLPTVN